jgi:hypothetical protein
LFYNSSTGVKKALDPGSASLQEAYLPSWFLFNVQSDYEMELARLKEQYKGKLDMAATQCKLHPFSRVLLTTLQ